MNPSLLPQPMVGPLWSCVWEGVKATPRPTLPSLLQELCAPLPSISQDASENRWGMAWGSGLGAAHPLLVKVECESLIGVLQGEPVSR